MKTVGNFLNDGLLMSITADAPKEILTTQEHTSLAP